MADDKKSFLLYCDQNELFNQLTDEQAGKLIKHLFAYVNDDKPVTDDLITNLAFTSIKQQLKRDLQKYDEKRGKNSISGLEGNLKRWHIDLFMKYDKGDLTLEEAYSIVDTRKSSPPDKPESHPIAKVAVNDTVTDNGNGTVNENDIKNKRVVMPFNSKEFLYQWDLWKDYKKQDHKFTYKSVQGEQAALKKLAGLSNNTELLAINIIHQSLENGWKGFFNIKENGQQGHKPTDQELADALRKYRVNN